MDLEPIYDVETALSWGDLEEEIFMDCPKGLAGAKHTYALVLKKSINGLIQPLDSTTGKQYKIYTRLVLKVVISILVSKYAKARKA